MSGILGWKRSTMRLAGMMRASQNLRVQEGPVGNWCEWSAYTSTQGWSQGWNVFDNWIWIDSLVLRFCYFYELRTKERRISILWSMDSTGQLHRAQLAMVRNLNYFRASLWFLRKGMTWLNIKTMEIIAQCCRILMGRNNIERTIIYVFNKHLLCFWIC